MSMTTPVIAPLGETAVTLSWGDGVDATVNERVHRAAEAIQTAALPEVTDLVPAYAALTVFYDPLHLDYPALADQLAEVVRAAESTAGAGRPAVEHAVPVHYNGDDLEEVARQTGLTTGEVVARHRAPTYRVYLLGFVPGFAYLGDLDPALVVPRRGTPRKQVPAGSVAIAGGQTAIYPLNTPGGWHLIGSTSLVMFDPQREPASLFRPGDRVRFVEESR
jgi:inhibitor of KinA